MIKALNNTTTAVMLACLMPNSAAPITWSPSVVRAALWDGVKNICPEEANLFELRYPGKIPPLLDYIVDPFGFSQFTEQDPAIGIAQSADFEAFLEMSQASPEVIQIRIFGLFYAAQVGAILLLETKYSTHVHDRSHSYVNVRQEAQDWTNLTKCLLPVGPRFIPSEENHLSEDILKTVEIYTQDG